MALAVRATGEQAPAAGRARQQQFRPIFFEQSPREVPAEASRGPDSVTTTAAKAIQASR